jgi:hypothetical protein
MDVSLGFAVTVIYPPKWEVFSIYHQIKLTAYMYTKTLRCLKKQRTMSMKSCLQVILNTIKA